jgi:hypothetical protein
MSEPCSNLDSAYSTLPTSPPSPNAPATEHPRRLSVTEFVEKLNAKLKRLFGSRRGSAEDEPPRPAPSKRRRSSVFTRPSGPLEPSNFGPSFEELVWSGAITLPNVSEYFRTVGEAGPVSYYTTADWDTFQTTSQAQRRNSTQAQLNRDMGYDGDTDVDTSDKLRKLSTRSSGRKRKDSYFSFSNLWSKSRRTSKVDKGGERRLSENEAATTSQEQPLLPPHPEDTSEAIVSSLTELGVLPSSDDPPLLVPKGPLIVPKGPLIVPKGPLIVPEADFESSSSSIPSLKFSAPTSSRSGHPAPTPSPTTQLASDRPITPPPGRPEVRPASSIASSPSSTSLSSVDSSDDSPTPAAQRVHQIAQNTAPASQASPSNTGARRSSLPIAIPHYTHPSSSPTSTSAQPRSPRYTLTQTGLTITQRSDPSTPSLSRHGDRPDPAPPSPPLRPTYIPSPTQMQTLSLGPPERPCPTSSASSEQLFHVSVEEVCSTPPRPAPRGPSGLAQSTLADDNGDEEEDVGVGPTEGGSSVRRRTGTNLSLREAYVEHEMDDTPTPPPRKLTPRKSVSQTCWWGGEGSSPGLPGQDGSSSSL